MISAVYGVDPGTLTLDNWILMAPGGYLFYKVQRVLIGGPVQSEEEWQAEQMEKARPNRESEENYDWLHERR